MPANTNQVYPLTPNVGAARISAANTARDGSGSNISTVYTAGANGDIVYRITVTDSDATASSTSVAQVIRIWIHDGTNFRLYQEMLMPSTAGTTSAKTGTISYTIPGGLYLNAAYTIRAAASLGSATTGQVDVVIEGNSF